MGHVQQSVSANTHATGFSAKLVYVESVDDDFTAIVRDKMGYRHTVRTDVMATKGLRPAVGETWMVDRRMGQWTFAAIIAWRGDITYTRSQVSHTTAPLAAGANIQTSIALPSAYRLYTITTNRPARVRLYDTAAHQASDLARSTSTIPPPGSGVMFDYLTASILLTATLGPVVDGVNLGTGDVPLTIHNADSVTGAVTVTLTYLRTE